VSVADLKAIAKTIKGDQALACPLYETGIVDARNLAGLVADGSKMKELQIWAEGAADMPMISEYAVPGVTVESPHARDLAMEGVRPKKEHNASSGWCPYSGLAATRPTRSWTLPRSRSCWDRGEGNQRGTQPGASHHEWVCDRGWNLCEASAGAGEGDGIGDWHCFRGYGRHGL
jgi:hypothetical protein